MLKRDTAVWSTQPKIVDGLEKRGDKLINEGREVKLARKSGRLQCGRITGINDDFKHVDFRPAGERETLRISIEEISQLTVLDRPFALTLIKSPKGNSWF